MSNIINLDADPFVPRRFTVHEHRKMGQFVFDPTAIELILCGDNHLYSHPGIGRIREFSHEARKRVEDKQILNANLLDWLLREENRHLIPEEWRGKWIWFWGTIYHTNQLSEDNGQYVRYLSVSKLGEVSWDWNLLNCMTLWADFCFSAILKPR